MRTELRNGVIPIEPTLIQPTMALADTTNAISAGYNAAVTTLVQPRRFLALLRHPILSRRIQYPDIYVFPRVNKGAAVEGQVDKSLGVAALGMNLDGTAIYPRGFISNSTLVGEENAETLNGEDPRATVITSHRRLRTFFAPREQTVVMGIAAATQDGIPHPGIVSFTLKPAFFDGPIKPFFQPADIQVVRREILFDVDAKNTAPVPGRDDLFACRLEGISGERTITYMRRTNDGKWHQTGSTIIDPHHITLQEGEGRYGLTTLNPIPEIGRNGRLEKVHAGSRVLLGVHWYKVLPDGIIRYTIGVVPAMVQKDGTFLFEDTPPVPIFSYENTDPTQEYNARKQVVYLTGLHVNRKTRDVRFALTENDTHVVWRQRLIEDLWDRANRARYFIPDQKPAMAA